MAEEKTYTVNGDEKDFFDGLGGGAPSFKFGKVGTGVKGTIVDQFRTFVTDTSNKVKTYPSGDPIPQLNVTLQTALRDWKGINPEKIPEDAEGNPLPASEDDGLRRIYIKYDMRRAVAVACRAAGEPYLKTGGTLAVKHSGDQKTEHPNPLPLYEAMYTPPADTSGDFLDTQDETPAPAAAPPAAPEPDDDEPPF